MSRRSLLCFSLMSLNFLPPLQAQSSFEERMHEIYKSSYSSEVSDDVWADYVSGLQTRTYKVAEGDTLWDLSLIFFGDGQYWSKIWSYNQGLTNPHLIVVGQEIAFFPGSVTQPPEFKVDPEQSGPFSETISAPIPGFEEFEPVVTETTTEVSTEISESSPQQTTSASPQREESYQRQSRLYPGAPSIPPPRDYLIPAPETLPSSFKDFEPLSKNDFDLGDVSLDLRPPIKVNPQFTVPSFLYSDDFNKYPRIGKVLESEDGNNYLALNDQIYVRSQEDLKIDEVFTVMTPDYKLNRNGVYGSIIRYAALVQIEKKLGQENLYTAKIINSLSRVQRGSWITREKIPTLADNHSGRLSESQLKIVGGGVGNTSRIYGEGDVVYLQGGSQQGVRAGDVLGVYKVRKNRYMNSKVDVSPDPIAHLKVFRTEENLSSAFILNSSEEVLPGDRTGKPTIIGKKASASEKMDLDGIENGLDFNTDVNSVEDFEVR